MTGLTLADLRKFLDPGHCFEYVKDFAVFFYRDKADFPSAEEQAMIALHSQPKFVCGCWGYVSFLGETFRAVELSKDHELDDAGKSKLTQRCGVQLMNLIAKDAIARLKAEADKPRIITET